MRRIELDLEHRYRGRFVGKHRLKGDSGLTVIGSAREAHVRLLGEDISGIHATFELQGNTWVLADMGSKQGTWVRKKPVVEQPIQGATIIHIGGHLLKAVPKEINSDIFIKTQPINKGEGKKLYHQVILRKAGYVVDSYLLPVDQVFTYKHGLEEHRFLPPKNGDWVRTELGDIVVQQRQTSSEVLVDTPAEKLKAMWDPSLKGPAAVAITVLLMVLGLMIFAPREPDRELVQVPPEDNRYTRMIFDAQKVQQERQQAERRREAVAPQASAPSSSATSEASGSGREAARVVHRINAAGLDQLVGKISARAAQNAHLIQSSGVSASQSQSGRALSRPGGSTLGEKGEASGQETGHRLDGVETAGRGGGSTAYQGVAGLSQGSVGTATVGVLEEETEVLGGLDRDVIARVIRSQLGQIRYCYERQLSANPDLYGKVQVRFTIGAAGVVEAQAIGATSLNNAMVEGCILRRIAGWQFPRPEGGTSVIVTYPFLFRSTAN